MKKSLFAFLFSPKGVDQREVPQVGAEEIESGKLVQDILDGAPPFDGAPFKAAPTPPPYDEFVEEDCEKFGQLLYPTRQVQQLGMDENFVWEASDGELIGLPAMAAPHLFYALRMIFNHSVPPAFRVGEFRRRAGVDQWPFNYRVQAIREMRKALAKRTDLEPWMKGEMRDMEENAAFLNSFNRASETVRYTLRDGWNTDQMREYLRMAGADADRYMPKTSPLTPLGERRAKAKAKRMSRAVPTDLRGFPGKRCMEHRSYTGLRKPRVECNACKQVYKARRQRRKDPKFYRKA